MNELLKTRIQKIGGINGVGECVIYVMSRDQRVRDNHALLAAQKHALAKKLPLAVVFCLLPAAKGRAREHYDFMLAGLEQVESDLAKLNIPFMMIIGEAHEKLPAVFHHTKPDAVYFDFSPLRGPKALLQKLARTDLATRSVLAKIPAMFVVDTHNVVPVWVTSDKREVGAYTIRPKIHRLLSDYLVEPDQLQKHPYIWPGVIKSIESLQSIINEVLKSVPSNGTISNFASGEKAAHKHIEKFISTKLATYGVERNDPTKDGQSDLSPYLHFGQISALRVALRLQQVAMQGGADLHLLAIPKMPKTESVPSTQQYSVDALLEEMIVRKELADNYCMYTADYDSLSAAPLWARVSLHKHRRDVREYLYTYEQLEHAQTHDLAWNTAQKQLTSSGKMHGYMRMYWAKKVLQWTESPEQAIEYLVKLNDFYSIDGGDPNGYAGILWSVGAVHDRPWGEREVFGVVRYMNYEGLKRKFALGDYVGLLTE